jgi:hypothetical protein
VDDRYSAQAARLFDDRFNKVFARHALPILHLIFANESIPSAFGISLTEACVFYDAHQTGQD